MAVTKVRSSTQLNIDTDLDIGHKVINVTDPTNPQDAATKNYVDSISTLTPANFVFSELPSGTIDGTNTTFTLANTPTVGTVRLYLNGLRQQEGVGKDYTISGSTITYLAAPLTGDVLLADYMK